jgi:hypothetical protein
MINSSRNRNEIINISDDDANDKNEDSVMFVKFNFNMFSHTSYKVHSYLLC